MRFFTTLGNQVTHLLTLLQQPSLDKNTISTDKNSKNSTYSVMRSVIQWSGQIIKNPAQLMTVSLFSQVTFSMQLHVNNQATLAKLDLPEVSTAFYIGHIGQLDTLGEANRITMHDHEVFLADVSGGVIQISLTNPAQPQVLNTYTSVGEALGVTWDGGPEVIIARGSGGAAIIDSESLTELHAINNLNTSGRTFHAQRFNNNLYMTDFISMRFNVANLPATGSPQYTASISLPDLAYDFIILNEEVASTAYVANNNQGVTEINLRNSPPTIIATYALPGRALGITAWEQKLLVTAWDQGLNIVDGDTKAFTTRALPGNSQSVAAGNGFATVASGSAGIYVIDVMSNNEIVAHAETAGEARGISYNPATHLIATASNLAGIEIFTADAVPQIINNRLDLNANLNTTVLVPRTALSASDRDHPDEQITYDTHVQSGFFWNAITNTTVRHFTQAQINNQEILFVPDGSGNIPSITFSLSDTIVRTPEMSAAITLNGVTPQNSSDNTNGGCDSSCIGTWVGAVAGTAGVIATIGIFAYTQYKKKHKETLSTDKKQTDTQAPNKYFNI
ncbi:MAG: hypothetical protein Tsb005_21310 [Gammaproteobacteria bacterium]